MNNELPIMLAWAFLGSFLLAALNTSRWTAILISVVAVWGMSISPEQIDLLMGATTEGYAWFAFLSVGVAFPALVVSAIAADMGAALSSVFRPKQDKSEESPEETSEESEAQSGG